MSEFDIRETSPGMSYDYGIWSVDDLIKQCNEALDELSKTFDKASDFSSNQLSFLKTHGPLIFSRDSWYTLFSKEHRIEMPSLLSAIMFSCFCFKDDNEYKLKWIFGFAWRLAKFPDGVRPVGRGYAYHIGIWYSWKGSKPIVSATYCTIDPETGEVVLAKIRKAHPRTIQSYPRRGRKRISKSCRMSPVVQYSEYSWEQDKTWLMPMEEGKGSFLEVCIALFNTHASRDAHWRFEVSRKTKKHREFPLRVTAMLDQSTVKKLFKERDKVPKVLTESGKRRPILHWARAHYRNQYDEPRNWLERMLWKLFPKLKRVLKTSTVRTHLRGLQEFIYQGLRCKIIVPGLHAQAQYEATLVAREEELDKELEKLDGDDYILASAYNSEKSSDRKPKWYG